MWRGNSRKRRRVCFVYYQQFGMLLFREAMALNRGGYDVDIICLQTTPAEARRETIEGVRVFRIQRRFGAEKSTLCYLARMVHFFTKIFLLFSYQSLRSRYDVIHFTSPPDAAIFTTLVPKMLGTKIILDIHDIGPELFMRKLGLKENHPIIILLKYLEKHAAHFADHVITVTHIWRDVLVSRSAAADKCSVMLNVPDTHLIRFDGNRDSGGDSFNLYYHGSIEEHFGVDTLVEAMPIIKKKVPQVNLHIYPSKTGRLLSAMIQKGKEKGMDEYVFFHDPVPYYDVPSVLRGADVGIVPTKNDTFSDEAVSIKSFEYIFSGIPIVISRTTGHSFYYNDQMVKFFEPCNSEDLAASVIHLYNNRERRREQVRSSLDFINNYSWDKIQLDYLDIVNHLIGRSDEAGPPSI